MADVKKGDDMFDYTHDRVVGVVDSAREASATIAALSDAGFPDDEVEILYGLQGEESVDPDGEDHGLKGKVIRVGEKIMGPEPKHAERHSEELRAGHYLVSVHAPDKDDRERVQRILEDHGGHFINHYGVWTVERLRA
jgi:hypothetical protein